MLIFPFTENLKNQLKIDVYEAKLCYIKQLILQARKDPRSAGQLWNGVNNILMVLHDKLMVKINMEHSSYPN